MSKKVLCIGDCCADIVIPYGLAKEKGIADVKFTGGGTVANTADGLGKLGVDVSFLGTCGTDYYGKALKKQLEDNGVDCSHFRLDDNFPTSQVLCVIDENNDRVNFLIPKENACQDQILDEDLPDSLLEKYDIFHTSGMILFNKPAAASIVRFLQKAHARNKIVTLDVNLRLETKDLDMTYLWQAIDCANYLFASLEDEIIPLTKISDPLEAAASLIRKDRMVIAREGKKGATIYLPDAYYYHNSFKVDVVDTLGAGDSYNAGFIYGLANNEHITYCNKLACATAAINITKKGARNCPTVQELKEFIDAH